MANNLRRAIALRLNVLKGIVPDKKHLSAGIYNAFGFLRCLVWNYTNDKPDETCSNKPVKVKTVTFPFFGTEPLMT